MDLVLDFRQKQELGRTGLAHGPVPEPFWDIDIAVLFAIVLGILSVPVGLKWGWWVCVWLNIVLDLAVIFRSYLRPLFCIAVPVGVALGAVMLASHVLPGIAIVSLAGIRRKENTRELGHRSFGLFVGVATGKLVELGHGAGIRKGCAVTLSLSDCAKNFLILGETGTGKSSRAIIPLLLQLLDSVAGLLIFDIKGDASEVIIAAGLLTGRQVQRIGPGFLGCNLLAGMHPNQVAGVLESAFRLLGQGANDSAFWVGLAVTRAENALSVLYHVPGSYNLSDLYSFCFSDKRRKEMLETASSALADMQVRESDGEAGLGYDIRRLKGALAYENTVLPTYGPREASGLHRALETALSRFADPEIQDAFCSGGGADIGSVLDGECFVVNIDRSRFKAASKVVYLFLKERFFSAVNSRAQMEPGLRKSRPVAFICDEYQECVGGGDGEFFSQSRSLSCIGVVAAQSVESFYRPCGDEDNAFALLGNFTNVLAFRSTPKTMDFLAKKIGEVEIQKESYTENHSLMNSSSSTTSTPTRQNVLSGQNFRTLGSDQAICFLSVDGIAFDDVLTLPQILPHQLLTERSS